MPADDGTQPLLSPPPGVGETALLEPLVKTYGLTPRGMTGAVVFNTEKLWHGDARPAP